MIGLICLLSLLLPIRSNAQIVVSPTNITSGPNTFTGAQTITINALGTTSTDGLSLLNSTAATVGTPVQISPRSKWCGTGYNSVSTLSETDCFFTEVLPATVAGTTTALFKLGVSINGGAATYPLTLSTLGNLSIGVNPSLNAILNLPNAKGLSTKNAAGTNDIQVFGTTGTDLIEFDGGGSLGVRFTGGIVNFGLSTAAKLSLNSVLFMSATAPTIASGGCTTPAITNSNGTAKFTVTIGTTCVGVKTITLTLPTSANDWQCDVVDNTTPQSFTPVATGTSTTAVVISNYARTTGLAIDFVDSEVLKVKCLGG